MKILFLARHFSYLRLFESAIAELAERGHTIHLSADREESLGGAGLVERLAARYPGVTVGWTPGRQSGAWSDLGRKLRLGIDYLRFLDSRYDAAPRLRGRSEERTPQLVRWLARLPGLRGSTGRQGLAWVLRQLEQAVPRSREIEAFYRGQTPDVVLITPLVDLGSPQIDHHLSARALGLRTVLCVGSWDHLSSKSLLRAAPDLVTVWNETQKQEAVELHHVPSERIVVTGAQCYDLWFGRRPSRSREVFCEQAGLDPTKPFVLYVCSSLFKNTANEARFVERWIQHVRGSADPVLREAGILVRPHPRRLDEWQQVDLTEFKNVVCFGSHPVDPATKDDYFDSLHYGEAVVGLNTSAFLEAAIAGKPVLSVLLPEISRDNQEGTLHFHYLLEVGGGLLQTARSLEEHTVQLAATLADPRPGIERARRFTEGFIRPQGLDDPSTPRFARAVEDVARIPAPVPVGAPPAALAARVLLLPWLAVAHIVNATHPWRKETRYKYRRLRRHARKQLFLKIRHFAVARLKQIVGEEPPPLRQESGAILTPKLNKHRDPAKSLLFPGVPEVGETKEMITMLGRQNRPIVVGPWLTEAGFELLYWIPFLAWAKAYASLHDDQLIVVSRGGAAPWYRHITPHYHDILSLYTADEFRQRNDARVHEQRGRLKHIDLGEFDHEIIERVKRARGLDSVKILHPSLMYNLFNVFWRQTAPITLVEAFSVFRPLPKLPLGDLAAHLPREYVAVKFYANSALPDTAANRALIAQVLSDLAATTDVVLLSTGQRYDDHSDFAPQRRDRLHTVEHLMTPETNLEVQTRVICGAKAFVGTYGGFSYLAPFCGTSAVAFYSNPTAFRFDHLEVSKRVFSSLKSGSFVPLDAKDLDVVRLALGRVDQLAQAGVNVS
ncbi:MAG: hypothetical protein EXQ53_08785 [Acidobacteria bacterium]|nr:hypothetical protein [Acidobacteriota bacterium]